MITTLRLDFRLLQAGDEKYMFPEIDEELTRYWIDWEPPANIEEVRQKIERSLQLSRSTIDVEFLAFHKQSGEFVGLCGIVPYKPTGEFEIDVWVKHSMQGQGYATEMVGALIEWARQNLSLEYIVYSVTEGNLASAAIIKRLQAPLLRTKIMLKRGQQKNVYDYKLTLH